MARGVVKTYSRSLSFNIEGAGGRRRAQGVISGYHDSIGHDRGEAGDSWGHVGVRLVSHGGMIGVRLVSHGGI